MEREREEERESRKDHACGECFDQTTKIIFEQLAYMLDVYM